ncbi:MAG: hypothetical protein WAW73_17465 [Rhodoferax sp.]
MKLKYVGLKVNGSTAFKAQTGITWLPGDCHEVKDDIAAKMLKHPDVFALDAGGTAALKAAEAPAIDTSGITLAPGGKVETTQSTSIKLKDGAVVVLDGMEKAELHALAKTHGVKIHHQAGAAKVIEALQAAFKSA